MMGLRYRSADALKAVTPTSARRWLVRHRLAARQLTSGQRVLPDFLVIGAQRSGTSSLYKYLGRHPDVAPSLRKEVGYFTFNYQKGEAWYRSHFPLTMRSIIHTRMQGNSLKSFEATPDYLLDPRVPSRAAALLPDTKLIALLRNPVDRAYSHYLHMRRFGFEDLSFEEAIEAEHERIQPDKDSIVHDPDHRARALTRFSYVERGKYAEQLRAWLAHYAEEQLLVVRSEDLFNSPDETIGVILDHVGLAPWTPTFFANYSYTGRMPDHSAMAATTRANLRSLFSSHNDDLSGLLGRDLDWD